MLKEAGIMASETNEPTSDSSLPEQEPAPADNTPPETAPYQLPIPHWVFSMIGHILAALIGLGLGYLILKQYWPEKLPW
jgi:hypothetical protein